MRSFLRSSLLLACATACGTEAPRREVARPATLDAASAAPVPAPGSLPALSPHDRVPQTPDASLKVELGEATASADFDEQVIHRHVGQKLDYLRFCYQKRLLNGPPLQGTVTVRFTLNRAGAVVAVEASGLDEPMLEACIESAIREIRFPKVRTPVLNVVLPITFAPGP